MTGQRQFGLGRIGSFHFGYSMFSLNKVKFIEHA